MKKVFGIVFITLGVFLGFAFIAYIPRITISIQEIFSGDPYQAGHSLGGLIFAAILVGLIFLLIKFGLKWIKRSPKNAA
jgi:hypothetical protein